MRILCQPLCTMLLLLIAVSVHGQIPQDGLKVFYPFDQTALDRSGNNRNATSNSNVSYYNLGSDDYSLINSSYDAITYYDFGGQDEFFAKSWSSAVKMKTGTMLTYVNIMEIGSGTTNALYFRIRKSGARYYLEAGFYNVSDNTGYQTSFQLSFDPAGAWHTYGVSSSLNETDQTRTMAIYVDGLNVKEETLMDYTENVYDTNYTRLNITNRDGGNMTFLSTDGGYNDFVFYDRALNATEMQQYHSTCSFVDKITVNEKTLGAVYNPRVNVYWRKAGKQVIDIEQLKPGLYLLQTDQGGQVKFIKE